MIYTTTKPEKFQARITPVHPLLFDFTKVYYDTDCYLEERLARWQEGGGAAPCLTPRRRRSIVVLAPIRA